jgi:transcriptional regulator with XRE-family HTH domain
MSRPATKAQDNAYYIARIDAISGDDMMSSREGASEILGMDRTRLSRIERGTLIPYPEEVLNMAHVYNAPELTNYYCSKECPLGKQTIRPVETGDLDRLTISALSALQHIAPIKDMLIEVAADGIISEEERPKFKQILDALYTIADNAQSLRLWAEKNLK